MTRMKLWSESFKNNERMPERFAFGKHSPDTRIDLSDNENPHLAWNDAPAATKSFVLICYDPDVPTKADDVNQEGKIVPASLERADFYHWILVDLSAKAKDIPAGEFSAEIVPQGKEGPAAPFGTRQGLNNYTEWFQGDEDMEGKYFGYDGPCPPWNDEIIHHYVFTLYALDVEKCDIAGEFTGPEVLKVIEGHILEQATLIGTYAINPNAVEKSKS